jgi:hypothetical protein
MESNLGQRQESAWNYGSLYLSLGGWTIILSAITTMIFTILPLKLGQPGWQLNAVSAFFGASANILIGSLLISLARVLNPQDSQLKKNAALVRKLAGVITILMIVLIPFSFYAGARTIRANQATGRVGLKQWKKQLRDVQTLSSEAEMRTWAASLPDPPQLPAVFDAPFPVIKKRMLTNITGQINLVQNQIEENFRGQWMAFLPDFFRNSILALLMAMGFSALSAEGFLPGIILPIARNMLRLGPNNKS